MTSRWQEGDHSNEDAATTFHCRALAELRSAVAAAQLAEPAAFDESQRQTQAAAGLRAVRRGRGVAGQVALARRMSPHRAGRDVRSAKVLVELPRTFAALRAGEISEWRALMVARETGWLSREHRLGVDVMIAAQLGTLGDRSFKTRFGGWVTDWTRPAT